MKLTKTAAAVPATKPSQVFPGEIAGASLCRPNSASDEIRGRVVGEHREQHGERDRETPVLGDVAQQERRSRARSRSRRVPSSVVPTATVGEPCVPPSPLSRNANAERRRAARRAPRRGRSPRPRSRTPASPA